MDKSTEANWKKQAACTSRLDSFWDKRSLSRTTQRHLGPGQAQQLFQHSWGGRRGQEDTCSSGDVSLFLAMSWGPGPWL